MQTFTIAKAKRVVGEGDQPVLPFPPEDGDVAGGRSLPEPHADAQAVTAESTRRRQVRNSSIELGRETGARA